MGTRCSVCLRVGFPAYSHPMQCHKFSSPLSIKVLPNSSKLKRNSLSSLHKLPFSVFPLFSVMTTCHLVSQFQSLRFILYNLSLSSSYVKTRHSMCPLKCICSIGYTSINPAVPHYSMMGGRGDAQEWKNKDASS